MPKNPLDWLEKEFAHWEGEGLRRERRVRRRPQGSVIDVDGEPMVNFGSNDYLDLARRLSTNVGETLEETGWGSGASPLVSGRGKWHAELERRLAEFEGVESALLFASGYAANMGTIAALAGPGDVILSDALNHASIIDGCRLSGASIRVYEHADADDLARGLAENFSARRRFIVTDTLFSMAGDFAPPDRITELAERYEAVVIVDEAHATGVLGERGRGVCELHGVESGVHVRVGTLSKALGSIGGFVAGSHHLIEWLVNRARPYIFSTAFPEAAAVAGLAALDVVDREPDRRRKVVDLAARLRWKLQSLGMEVGSSQSQIVPLVVGSARKAMDLSQTLRARGFFLPAIRPPSVPAEQSMLRVSVTAGHCETDIDRFVETLGEASIRCTVR